MDTNKSILITGASSGIGKACALHLDSLGFKVYAGVRNNKDLEVIQKEGSDLLQPVILDVTKDDTIQKVFELIAETTSYPLWGLVNNAGIGIGGVVEVTPVEELRKILEVNVIGMHAVTMTFLPILRRNRGRIVNVGSSASYFASPGQSSYSASKFAVRAFTDSLRVEMKLFDMHVALVAPGAIESAMWEKDKEYKQKLRESISPELAEIYKPFRIAADHMIERVKPISALEVAKAVEHAMTSDKPKCIYIVGRDAKMVRLTTIFSRRRVTNMMMKHILEHTKKAKK